MRRRDAGKGTRAPRRRPGKVALWTPLVLVVLLLAAAVVADAQQWGPRHLGWKGADPDRNPAAVLAPGVLELPEYEAEVTVAEPAPAGELDPEAVRAAVRKVLRDDDLGGHVLAAVADLEGNAPAFTSGEGTVVPASTAKMLTTVAALQSLGPDATFATRVVRGAEGGDLVLVGGGDPLLASKPSKPTDWPQRADVVTLAQRTAEVLRGEGLTKVRLRYDTSLFSGPSDNPEWERGYVRDGVVAPITALWVDEGRHPRGWGRVDNPARTAATTFADALREEGIEVSRASSGEAPADAVEVASVTSPPLDQVVQWVVAVSDNEGAEVLARQVGLADADEGSFEVGSRAVLDVLTDLGVETTGDVLHDGSGLSRNNEVTATTLLEVVRLAASDEHPRLRAAVDGLPVAGFSGSLARRFDVGADPGLGRVRAKTGTLTGVHSLAGLVTGADGVPMVFVIAADDVDVVDTLGARAALDQFGAALAACSCGTSSADRADSATPAPSATASPTATS